MYCRDKLRAQDRADGPDQARVHCRAYCLRLAQPARSRDRTAAPDGVTGVRAADRALRGHRNRALPLRRRARQGRRFALIGQRDSHVRNSSGRSHARRRPRDRKFNGRSLSSSVRRRRLRDRSRNSSVRKWPRGPSRKWRRVRNRSSSGRLRRLRGRKWPQGLRWLRAPQRLRHGRPRRRAPPPQRGRFPSRRVDDQHKSPAGSGGAFAVKAAGFACLT